MGSIQGSPEPFLPVSRRCRYTRPDSCTAHGDPPGPQCTPPVCQRCSFDRSTKEVTALLWFLGKTEPASFIILFLRIRAKKAREFLHRELRKAKRKPTRNK